MLQFKGTLKVDRVSLGLAQEYGSDLLHVFLCETLACKYEYVFILNKDTRDKIEIFFPFIAEHCCRRCSSFIFISLLM
jgi:hypothetical protein